MHYRSSCFRSFISLAFFLLFSVGAYASHIVAADLTYAWVSGNTYKVTLALYGDCGPASAAALATLSTSSPKICLYNGTTYVDTFSLTIDAPTAGVEVTQHCPGDTTQCVSTTSSIPGIKLFKYSGTYTLSGTSASWVFRFNGAMGSAAAGRATSITNISAGTTIQLEATLNNTGGHNSSPVMHRPALPFFGINMYSSYNPVAIDSVDFDSLAYILVSAKNATSTCSSAGYPVTYVGPPTFAWGTQPITDTTPIRVTAGSYSFNKVTGTISFYTGILQRGVVVYEIHEYRSGVLVGTLQREMTISASISPNHLPRGQYTSPVSCVLYDSVDLWVYDTVGAFSVSIPAVDADTDTIYVTPLSIPAGATFTTTGNGTTTPVSTFAWNTTSVPVGLYTFFVDYKDNNCPIPGSQTVPFTVGIIPHTIIPPPPPTYVHDNINAIGNIKIYPNPSGGEFAIEAPTPFYKADITVTDVLGRVVKQETAPENSNKFTVNLTGYPTGSYNVRVVTGNKTYCEKVVLCK